MKPITRMLFLAFLFPVSLIAQDRQDYQCTMGDLTRRVEIASEPGVAVPCEVHYYKDSEAPGEQQVLWRALNEAGYCETKAAEFVARLQEMGWQCNAASAAPVAEPVDAATAAPMEEAVDAATVEESADTVDDTADLAPAKDPGPQDPR